jgi:hypothetical protein
MSPRVEPTPGPNCGHVPLNGLQVPFANPYPSLHFDSEGTDRARNRQNPNLRVGERVLEGVRSERCDQSRACNGPQECQTQGNGHTHLQRRAGGLWLRSAGKSVLLWLFRSSLVSRFLSFFHRISLVELGLRMGDVETIEVRQSLAYLRPRQLSIRQFSAIQPVAFPVFVFQTVLGTLKSSFRSITNACNFLLSHLEAWPSYLSSQILPRFHSVV